MSRLEILSEETLQQIHTYPPLKRSVSMAMLCIGASSALIIFTSRYIESSGRLAALQDFLMQKLQFFSERYVEVEAFQRGAGFEYFLTFCVACTLTPFLAIHYLLKLFQLIKLRRLTAQVTLGNWATYFFVAVVILVLLHKYLVAPTGLTDGSPLDLRRLLIGPPFVILCLITSYGVVPLLSIPVLLIVCQRNAR